MGLSDIPSGDDYSEWASLLAAKAKDVCGQAQYAKTPLLFRGQSILSSLSSEQAYGRLVNFMKKDGSLGHYLNIRWYGILVFVIGIVLLMLGIALSFIVRGGGTLRFFNRLFCGLLANNEEKERSLRVRRSSRLRMLWLTVIGCILVLLVTVFSLIASHQLSTSNAVVQCNFWAQLSGHFNGAGNLTYGDQNKDFQNVLETNVVTNWMGTVPIRDLLDRLDKQTTGGPDNEIYQSLTASEGKLRVKLQPIADDMISRLQYLAQVLQKHTTEYTALNSAVKTERGSMKLGTWDDYSLLNSLEKVFTDKSTQFQNELQSTLASSWQTITDLIEKYAGTDSALMTKANAAVQSTKTTLKQIDSAFAQMVVTWNDKHKLVIALVVVSVVLIALCAAMGVSGAVLSVICGYKLSKSIKDYQLPSESTVRLWKICFVCLCIGAGLCAFTSGLNFLVALVGTDVCDLVDKPLLDEGDWDILGSKMNHPVDPSEQEVYMPEVYDVCIRRSGEGMIGMTMGLDEPIDTLTKDVNAALAEIDLTTEILMKRKSREVRVSTLQLMVQEAMRAPSHQQHFANAILTSIPKMTYTFDNLQQLTWEDHTASDSGERVMLSFTPDWPDTLKLANRGFAYSLGSMRDAYDMLNAVSDAAYTANNKSLLPRFCGVVAKMHGQPCKDLQKIDNRDVVDLGAEYYPDDTITNWTSTLDADLPTFGKYRNKMAERTFYLIAATNWMERAALTPGSGPFLDKGCSRIKGRALAEGEPATCVYDDYRLDEVDGLWDEWKSIRSSYDTVVASVDEYVGNDVKPAITQLLESANTIIHTSNCQFEGTMLDYAVREPLCTSMIPGTVVASITLAACALLLFLLAFHIWNWLSYILELVQGHQTASHYDEASMKRRPDYVSYAGLATLNHGDHSPERVSVAAGNSFAYSATYSYEGVPSPWHGEDLVVEDSNYRYP